MNVLKLQYDYKGYLLLLSLFPHCFSSFSLEPNKKNKKIRCNETAASETLFYMKV